MLRLRRSTFIVQASLTIITYDRQHIFIIQATGFTKHFLEELSGAGHFVHSFTPTCWNVTLCQTVMLFHQTIAGSMKFRHSLIIIVKHVLDNNEGKQLS
jgi:hypothetical protein